MSLPVRKRSEKRRRTELLVVRLTPTERAVLNCAAATVGQGVAEYVRRHLFTDSERQGE